MTVMFLDEIRLIILLMIIDIITGIINGMVNKTLSHITFKNGLIQKLTTLFLLTASMVMETIFLKCSSYFEISITNIHIFNFTLLYTSSIEMISIGTNLKGCGLKIPSRWTAFFKEIIENLK